MLEGNLKQYIQAHFLRANEEIDEYQFKEFEQGLIVIPIVKRTARRRRKTRELLVQRVYKMDDYICDRLSKVFTSPHVKKKWSSAEGDPFLYEGFLMKLIDFETDEKSVKVAAYVMGFPLFGYVKKREEVRDKESQREWMHLRSRFHEVVDIPASIYYVDERLEFGHDILRLFNLVFHHELSEKGVQEDKQAPYNWRLKKKGLFLHFLLAFYQVMKTRERYDWKEIGAQYYGEIGGSKKFDAYKKEFLQMLEEFDFPPVSLAGLRSFGSIAYIPFSGPIKGKLSQYDYGTIHSVTDHQVYVDSFSTTAETLWLVENRGVITRFSYEKEFLRQANSLMIGVEGQLRSAVKKLLAMVVQNSHIKQVMIWTDYDEAGVMIADTIYDVLHKNSQQIVWKWIVPGECRVVHDHGEYHSQLQHFLRTRSSEQEEDMGGPAEWVAWMQQ